MSSTRRSGIRDGCGPRRQSDCRSDTWPTPVHAAGSLPGPATSSTIGATTARSRDEGMLSWILEPDDVAQAPRVRRLVMTALRNRAASTSDLDAAEVVVAELLNNALTHTPGPAWITLSWDGPHPLLTVSDVGPGFGECPELLDERQRLVPRLPSDELSERGRGLYLIAQLTRDLVLTQRPTGGSVVSVTLGLDHA